MSMKIEDIEKFNKIADDEINVYSLEVIDGVVKEEICKEILTTCGIAEDVAPYIEFLKEDEGGFKKLNEFIKKNSSDDEWETELFDDMYIIGFHDNNYITLDKEGRVMYVDYERMTKELVNNSLEKFFDIIIKFNFMIEDYYNDNPDGDFFEDGMTDEVIEKFIVYINKIDENVLEDNTFWNLVIEECREL